MDIKIRKDKELRFSCVSSREQSVVVTILSQESNRIIFTKCYSNILCILPLLFLFFNFSFSCQPPNYFPSLLSCLLITHSCAFKF